LSDNVVVIGAGADALVAAHLIARGGRRVTVLEDGATVSEEAGWVPPRVASALGLQPSVDAPDPWASIVLPEGGTLELWRDVERTAQSLRAFSERDAAKWPEFSRRMAALAAIFEGLYLEPPVTPLDFRLALRVRRLGREGMVDLMRVLPMSVAELLDDWFETDALKGALAAMGIANIRQGPRSGGTAFRMLHHHVGSPPGVFRPPRSNLVSLLRAQGGITLRPGRAHAIRVKAGRAHAVVVDGGEELAADTVLAATHPRRALLELADTGWLDPELARSVAHVRSAGVAARIAFQTASRQHRVYAPSLDHLERAYDDAKYGRVSRQPYVEAYPTGNGVDVHFQYVPYEGAEDLAAAARRLLPGLGSAEASVLWPKDLEQRYGWPQGQPHHAELALDQALWARPLPELARYRTPIEGLWLCGPATHPGAGIVGASGYNCARAILNTKR
jgi:phytoene dehydrogenase-like protein